MSSSCSAPSPSYELYKLFRHNDSSLTAGYAVGGALRPAHARAKSESESNAIRRGGVWCRGAFLTALPLARVLPKRSLRVAWFVN